MRQSSTINRDKGPSSFQEPTHFFTAALPSSGGNLRRSMTSDSDSSDGNDGVIIRKFELVITSRGHNVRNWQNIWTTLTPPTSPAPTHARRLSVLDTIKAAAEASKRLYSSSMVYSEKVVKPFRLINKTSYQTPEPDRLTTPGFVRRSNLLPERRSYAQYVEPQPARPTAETSFSGYRQQSNTNIQDRNRYPAAQPQNDRYGLSPGANNVIDSKPAPLSDRYGSLSVNNINTNIEPKPTPRRARYGPDINSANNNIDSNGWRPKFSLNEDRSRSRDRAQSNDWRSNSMPDIVARDQGTYRHTQQGGRVKTGTLVEESSMFDTGARSHVQPLANRYDIHGSAGKDPIALYAIDGHGHGLEPSPSSNTFSATRPPSHRAATAYSQMVTRAHRYGIPTPRNRYSQSRKTTEQQRFKVLPNGSIVDYGYLGRGRPQPKTTRASFVTRATNPPRLFPTAVTTMNQTKPTAMAALTTTKQLNYTQHPTIPRLAQTIAAVPPTISQRATFPTSKAPSLPPKNPLTNAPTGAQTLTTRLTTKPKYVSPSGGISVVDMYNFTTGFAGWNNTWNSSYDHTYGFYDNITYPPTLGLKTNAAVLANVAITNPVQPKLATANPTQPKLATPSPALLNAIAATLAPPLVTTTAPKLVAALAATTTAPKKKHRPQPQDDYFLKQGGVPINITYANDNHVCPSSRARWQDFTVYLETKPRLCMVQITFNARYKREPIYHKTWWGNSVEWIYRTVYDPEVKIVDLHGWRGSNWYG